eukprot:COSAG05_NODE_2230_length_3362_cov_2.287466_4_plen_118_part_00
MSLDSVLRFARDYAARAEEIVNNSKPLIKMQAIAHSFSRWGDRDKDAVWSFAARGSHKSAARVLAEIAASAVFMGKLLGVGVLVLQFVGADITTNLVVIGEALPFLSPHALVSHVAL